MAASTALAARSGWSVYRGIRWSIYRGIGGQFTPESGGQYQRILQTGFYATIKDKTRFLHKLRQYYLFVNSISRVI